jgi:hypothetical protein
MGTAWSRFKPAVGKDVLILLCGIMWVAVGSMLLVLAAGWLRETPTERLGARVTAGLIAALVIHHFGFLRIVDKNLGRIMPVEGKRCVFAFQSWKSYLNIFLMVAMGIALRHSPLPKSYLAVLYVAIGTALILSSVRYLRVWVTGILTHRRQG